MDLTKLLLILQIVIKVIEMLIGAGLIKAREAPKIAAEIVKAMLTADDDDTPT